MSELEVQRVLPERFDPGAHIGGTRGMFGAGVLEERPVVIDGPARLPGMVVDHSQIVMRGRVRRRQHERLQQGFFRWLEPTLSFVSEGQVHQRIRIAGIQLRGPPESHSRILDAARGQQHNAKIVMSTRISRPSLDRALEFPSGIGQFAAVLVDESGVVAGSRGEGGIVKERAVRGQGGRKISASLESQGTPELARASGFAGRWLRRGRRRGLLWPFFSRLDRGWLRGLRRAGDGRDRLIPRRRWRAATWRHGGLIGHPRGWLALPGAQCGPRERDHGHTRQRQQREPPLPAPRRLCSLPHGREDRPWRRSHRVDLLSRRSCAAGAPERIEQLAHGCCDRTGTEMACAGGSTGVLK
jgi:hypothetical protein